MHELRGKVLDEIERLQTQHEALTDLETKGFISIELLTLKWVLSLIDDQIKGKANGDVN